MIFLITCAGSKRRPFANNPSHLEALSFNIPLHEARMNLIHSMNIELDWDRTLPAWQLYSGNRSKTYPRITDANWAKPCINIKILSALFGWIKYTDLIPYYDLRMSDRIPVTGQRVNLYWHQQNLLHTLIHPQDVDLLSSAYRKAIYGNSDPVATIPNVQFTDYGVQKGIWMNNQLNNIICNL